MRAFTDVLRFELRLHLTSPLFWGVALLFFALHLLTLTRTGINLGENEQIALNSAWLIFQTELVLGLFGMLPAIVFAVRAITRDGEHRTTELFFTTPVPRAAFLLGRFSAGTLVALVIGCIGVLGALAGSFAPWVNAARIAPFDWRPWVASLFYLVIPNLLVFCALFVSVAALTRSTALTFGVALAVVVLDIFINVSAVPPVQHWLLLADPIGGLPIAEAGRFWTVDELNTQLPTALLLPNRLVWLGIAACALMLTLLRYRMELVEPRFAKQRSRKTQATLPTPRTQSTVLEAHSQRFDPRATALQLMAQLRMDWRGVWQSPLFWLVLALAAFGIWSEGSNLRLNDASLYPATPLMLDFVRTSLIQFVVLAIIYFSAILVHRERDCNVEGISGAAPAPDWISVASKTLALCGVVTCLLAVAMIVSISMQALAGFRDHQLGVFLEGTFVYNGFYYWMLCTLAVLVQVLSPGKWSGMILVLIAFVAVLALPALDVEHLLLTFRIPLVVYSDMNGFGHYQLPTYTLVAYWGTFCVLLLAAAHLLYPRGFDVSFGARLRDARSRLSRPLLRTCAGAALIFSSLGVFIFYNTNILNEYVTAEEERAAQARYEIEYGRYRDAPSPSIHNPDVHVEVFAAERRLESRGTAALRNNETQPIAELVVSVDKRNRVDELIVESATLAASDPARGFYLFKPAAPLEPGESLNMRWALTRENQGFPNSNADNEVIANGMYLRSTHIPIPGYCNHCELTTDRERFGLPPLARLPALGDPTHLDDLWPGIDRRSSFRTVIGTDADQTAVGPGELRRVWNENGRRYFEYALAGPVWPLLTVQSARFEVARDSWNDIALEVYHDPKHSRNVRAMLETAKQGLEYFSAEFGSYPFPYYRIAEYARYRSNVQAGVGTIAYSEGSGFMVDLRAWNDLDYATLHELAHQWWGNVYGARMQGRQFLNEGLAQYSTLMAFKRFADEPFARRLAARMHDSYLDARSSETIAEQPVAKTEDQAYISYSKAPLALYSLQELIGAAKVNGALRAYHAQFLDMKPPLPTSLDVIAELRAVAGPEHQDLITDLFEKIVLYDVAITTADVREVDDGYEVALEVTGKQLEANGHGIEREVPLDTWFQVAVFPPSERDVLELEPLYIRHHRLRSGAQRLVLRVASPPGSVAVDPFRLMIDRIRDNNLLRLPTEPTARAPNLSATKALSP